MTPPETPIHPQTSFAQARAHDLAKCWKHVIERRTVTPNSFDVCWEAKKTTRDDCASVRLYSIAHYQDGKMIPEETIAEARFLNERSLVSYPSQLEASLNHALMNAVVQVLRKYPNVIGPWLSRLEKAFQETGLQRGRGASFFDKLIELAFDPENPGQGREFSFEADEYERRDFEGFLRCGILLEGSSPDTYRINEDVESWKVNDEQAA